MPRFGAYLITVLLLAGLAAAADASANPQLPPPQEPTGTAPPITAITPQIVQPVPPPSPNATEQELENEADKLRGDKMYVDAMEYYRAALGKAPVDARDKAEQQIQRSKAAVLFNKLGIAQLQLLRLGDARKSFERSTRFYRAYADAYNNLGVVYYVRRNYGKAVKEYSQAIKLDDGLASAHSTLGTAYFARKEFDKAMVEYARALQLDPGILDRNSRTGVSMRMSSPEDQAAYQYMLARLFAEMKDTDKCLLYLRKALEDGYPKIQDAYKDEAFAAIRKDARFSQVMQVGMAPPR